MNDQALLSDRMLVDALRAAAKASCWPAPQHVQDTLFWIAADRIVALAAQINLGRASGIRPDLPASNAS